MTTDGPDGTDGCGTRAGIRALSTGEQ